MKTNKKGFTIVELVIVVAIIAILAAVLIPVFSNVVKKANLSNDQSNVRNMNTALATEVIPDTKFSTAGKAISALNNCGWNEGRYTTYNGGYHYAYSLEENRMYLLDENNQVVFPEGSVALSSLWGLYMDERMSAVPGITKYVAVTNITNTEHFNAVFNTSGYQIDLNGHFIAVDATTPTNVTVSNGILIKGATEGSDMSSDYTVVDSIPAPSDNAITEWYSSNGVASNGAFTFSNKIFTVRLFIGQSGGAGDDYIFNNCIFYGGGINVDDGNGSGLAGDDSKKLIFNNCQFVDIASYWAVLSCRSVELNGCTFTNLSSRGAVQIHEDSKNMTVTITNTTFCGTAETYPIIRFVGKDPNYRHSNEACLSSFTVSGCTFNSLNKAKGIIGFSGTGSNLYNYTGAEGQPSVTFSNNKISSDIPTEKYLVDGAQGNTLGTLLAASAH